MTKADLVEGVYATTGITKRESQEIVETVLAPPQPLARLHFWGQAPALVAHAEQ